MHVNSHEGLKDKKRERKGKAQKKSQGGFIAKCPICLIRHRVTYVRWTGDVMPRIYCLNCKSMIGRMNYEEMPVRLERNTRRSA